MIVAQSVLFIAFIKVFTADTNSFKGFPLMQVENLQRIVLIAIAILGIISSAIWVLFIHRQRTVLYLCKTYLRDIEKSLTQFGVPLGYWTYESIVSHPESYKEEDLRGTRSRNPRLFPSWHFPTGKERLKIGLTNIEEGIAWFLCALWIILAVLLGLSAAYMTRNNPPKELDMNTVNLIALLVLAVISTLSLVALAIICVAKCLKPLNKEITDRLAKLEEQFKTHRRSHPEKE